ncbi:hypothetical protein MMPV_002520 [Pyropia vietnamensis]
MGVGATGGGGGGGGGGDGGSGGAGDSRGSLPSLTSMGSGLGDGHGCTDTPPACGGGGAGGASGGTTLTFFADSPADLDGWLVAAARAAAAAPPPGSPQVTDFYELGHKIGGGVQSEVFQATDRITAAPVAVKVIRRRPRSGIAVGGGVSADGGAGDGDGAHDASPPPAPSPVVAEGLEPHPDSAVARAAASGSVEETYLARELDILRSLRHPHVLRTLDIFSTPSFVHVVTEVLAGSELYDYVSEASFSEAAAAAALRDVLEGVAYLHRRGIVHRDIKLENLLCENTVPPLQVKLADFGFSVRVHADRGGDDDSDDPWGGVRARSGGLSPPGSPPSPPSPSTSSYDPDASLCALVGTSYYLAPEMLRRQRYGKPVDLWAVGVVAYLCLSGRFPFGGGDTTEYFTQVLERELFFPPDEWGDVSAAAKDFVSALLTKDPARRMTVEEAVAHPWLALAHPRPVGVPFRLPSAVPLPSALPGEVVHCHPTAAVTTAAAGGAGGSVGDDGGGGGGGGAGATPVGACLTSSVESDEDDGWGTTDSTAPFPHVALSAGVAVPPPPPPSRGHTRRGAAKKAAATAARTPYGGTTASPRSVASSPRGGPAATTGGVPERPTSWRPPSAWGASPLATATRSPVSGMSTSTAVSSCTVSSGATTGGGGGRTAGATTAGTTTTIVAGVDPPTCVSDDYTSLPSVLTFAPSGGGDSSGGGATGSTVSAAAAGTFSPAASVASRPGLAARFRRHDPSSPPPPTGDGVKRRGRWHRPGGGGTPNGPALTSEEKTEATTAAMAVAAAGTAHGGTRLPSPPPRASAGSGGRGFDGYSWGHPSGWGLPTGPWGGTPGDVEEDPPDEFSKLPFQSGGRLGVLAVVARAVAAVRVVPAAASAVLVVAVASAARGRRRRPPSTMTMATPPLPTAPWYRPAAAAAAAAGRAHGRPQQLPRQAVVGACCSPRRACGGRGVPRMGVGLARCSPSP